MPITKFTLYIIGHSPSSRRALAQFDQIANQLGEHELHIVDVLQDPESAERHKIVATPTLIRELPLPTLRFVGDLTNAESLRDELELS